MKHFWISANAALALLIGPAQAATTVKVDLWDKGATAEMLTDQAFGAATVDPAKANMGIRLSADHAPAGDVTFAVTNTSTDTIHEMIVIPLKEGQTTLPYIDDEARVNEDTAGDLGEVSELNPGDSGSLTLTLKPGTYILICNVPFHFVGGMWTLFTVDP